MFQKSDAKIQITIQLWAHLIRINYPLIAALIIAFVEQTLQISTKSTARFLSNSFLTRNSSGDEIANVNFLYDDIVCTTTRTTKYNRLLHKFRQRYRRGYVLERRFTKVSEITQCNGHYAVQSHSRLPILVPIESS